MSDDEYKPRWVRDYEHYNEHLGEPLETVAGPGTIIAGLLIIGVYIGGLVLFCVVVYLIGRAVVGG